MDLKDLRIGNIVQAGKRIYVVAGLSERLGGRVSLYALDAKDKKPTLSIGVEKCGGVELSDERLFKSRLEKGAGWFSFDGHTIPSKADFYKEEDSRKAASKGGREYNIKYIHELQNIYFERTYCNAKTNR